MPASFSTAMIARAAGLNNAKALSRLEDLERRGEVWRDGKRWTTEAPPTDLSAALDRLQARTSNLRIIRDRTPVG
jgi:DNA-binding IclR family transcriptional regulator